MAHPNAVAHYTELAQQAAGLVIHKPWSSLPTLPGAWPGLAKLPCISDEDPGANDPSDLVAEMINQIDEAECALAKAREALENGSTLAAESLFAEAQGWLEMGDE